MYKIAIYPKKTQVDGYSSCAPKGALIFILRAYTKSIEKISAYEDNLFNFLRYSADGNTQLKDLLTPKNSDDVYNKMVIKSFDNIFDDPEYIFK
jgi:hypothetical protein